MPLLEILSSHFQLIGTSQAVHLTLHEVIEEPEAKVGRELRGEIADRQAASQPVLMFTLESLKAVMVHHPLRNGARKSSPQ